jgi:hypothetical protein
MTLEDLGNLSEIIGAIAVVISLVYLAVQVRESSQVTRLLLQENFVSGQEQLIRSFLENEEMFRVWRLGTTTTDELSGDDQERFGLLLYGQMYRYHVMYQAIKIEPLEHKRCLIQIDRFAAMPAFRSWWSRQRSGFAFDPEYVKLVDDRIISIQNQQNP